MRSHHVQDHTLFQKKRSEKVVATIWWRSGAGNAQEIMEMILTRLWVLFVREKLLRRYKKFVSDYRSVSPLCFPREATFIHDSHLKFTVILRYRCEMSYKYYYKIFVFFSWSFSQNTLRSTSKGLPVHLDHLLYYKISRFCAKKKTKSWKKRVLDKNVKNKVYIYWFY